MPGVLVFKCVFGIDEITIAYTDATLKLCNKILISGGKISFKKCLTVEKYCIILNVSSWGIVYKKSVRAEKVWNLAILTKKQ